MEKIKKQLKIIVLFLVMYVIQFLIVPANFKNYYPISNEAYFLLYMSIFCIAVIGMLKISACIIYWLIGDILYCLMILVYHPAGAYGIGMYGMFAGTVYTKETRMYELIIIFIVTVVIQIVAEIVVKVIKVVQKKLEKHKNQKGSCH